jgi:hypothetical protein
MTEMTEEMETLLTLIGALAPERGPWKIEQFGFIRNAMGECPVCAAAHVVLGEVRYPNYAAQIAARVVLGDETNHGAWQLMNAADGVGSPAITKRLRAMLRVA